MKRANLQTFLRQNKGNAVVTVALGTIVSAMVLGVLFNALAPVYTATNIFNETLTVATAGTYVDLVNRDVVPGSEAVYNSTNTSITLGDGIANAADCGNEVGSDCYYNLTDGSKLSVGTFTTNRTGSFFVTYDYYPAGYSHSAADRSLAAVMMTFVLVGVMAMIAKAAGMF